MVVLNEIRCTFTELVEDILPVGSIVDHTKQTVSFLVFEDKTQLPHIFGFVRKNKEKESHRRLDLSQCCTSDKSSVYNNISQIRPTKSGFVSLNLCLH